MSSEFVLVTGAAGFIGSHTCEKMLLEGYKVIGIDNLNKYYSQKLKIDNLTQLKEHDQFRFIKCDIRQMDSLRALFKNRSFKIIIHLAAQAGVRYSLNNPFIYQQVNIGGTLNLLELVKEYNCENFLFASSSSVYGNQTKIPFSETDPIVKPVSIYAATKQAGEALCYTYHHLYGININCLRFFTVYGPRGRPDMSPHIFTNRLLRGETIQIYDSPNNTIRRDFSFISDIVEGIIKAARFRDGYQIFNLGYGSPIKLRDFLGILEELTGVSVNIEFSNRQPGDVDTTYADITKSKKLLGFKPEVNVQNGLGIYLDWFTDYFGSF